MVPSTKSANHPVSRSRAQTSLSRVNKNKPDSSLKQNFGKAVKYKANGDRISLNQIIMNNDIPSSRTNDTSLKPCQAPFCSEISYQESLQGQDVAKVHQRKGADIKTAVQLLQKRQQDEATLRRLQYSEQQSLAVLQGDVLQTYQPNQHHNSKNTDKEVCDDKVVNNYPSMVKPFVGIKKQPSPHSIHLAFEQTCQNLYKYLSSCGIHVPLLPDIVLYFLGPVLQKYRRQQSIGVAQLRLPTIAEWIKQCNALIGSCTQQDIEAYIKSASVLLAQNDKSHKPEYPKINKNTQKETKVSKLYGKHIPNNKSIVCEPRTNGNRISTPKNINTTQKTATAQKSIKTNNISLNVPQSEKKSQTEPIDEFMSKSTKFEPKLQGQKHQRPASLISFKLDESRDYNHFKREIDSQILSNEVGSNASSHVQQRILNSRVRFNAHQEHCTEGRLDLANKEGRLNLASKIGYSEPQKKFNQDESHAWRANEFFSRGTPSEFTLYTQNDRSVAIKRDRHELSSPGKVSQVSKPLIVNGTVERSPLMVNGIVQRSVHMSPQQISLAHQRLFELQTMSRRPALNWIRKPRIGSGTYSFNGQGWGHEMAKDSKKDTIGRDQRALVGANEVKIATEMRNAVGNRIIGSNGSENWSNMGNTNQVGHMMNRLGNGDNVNKMSNVDSASKMSNGYSANKMSNMGNMTFSPNKFTVIGPSKSTNSSMGSSHDNSVKSASNNMPSVMVSSGVQTQTAGVENGYRNYSMDTTPERIYGQSSYNRQYQNYNHNQTGMIAQSSGMTPHPSAIISQSPKNNYYKNDIDHRTPVKLASKSEFNPLFANNSNLTPTKINQTTMNTTFNNNNTSHNNNNNNNNHITPVTPTNRNCNRSNHNNANCCGTPTNLTPNLTNHKLITPNNPLDITPTSPNDNSQAHILVKSLTARLQLEIRKNAQRIQKSKEFVMENWK